MGKFSPAWCKVSAIALPDSPRASILFHLTTLKHRLPLPPPPPILLARPRPPPAAAPAWAWRRLECCCNGCNTERNGLLLFTSHRLPPRTSEASEDLSRSSNGKRNEGCFKKPGAGPRVHLDCVLADEKWEPRRKSLVGVHRGPFRSLKLSSYYRKL